MSFLTKNHRQDIVYWGAPVTDVYGARTFSTPIEIKGRWEDVQNLFVSPDGRELVSRAIVYLGQDVDIGGYLYLGTLVSISSAVNPKTVSKAYEIRSFNKIPSIKSTIYERVVFV